MHKISSTNPDSSHSKQLRAWFEEEWGPIDSFSSNDIEQPLPSPIIATRNNILMGGLSFSFAKMPQSTELGMWINAVLVSPKSRGLGIASKLIESAEIAAQEIGVKQLFVYSEYSQLYEKLGWQVQEIDGDSKVLMTELKGL